MTSAPVKDVKNILDNLTPGKQTSTKMDEKASFKDVWHRQVSANEPSASSDSGNARKVVQSADKVTDQSGKSVDGSPPEDELHSGEVMDKDSIREYLEDGELSEEELAAIMEILGTAVTDFAAEVAKTLGITTDELAAVLEGLNMTESDLLQPDALTQVAMAVNSETDVMSLLTNGELYRDVQNLNNKLQQMLQDCSSELQMDPEKLQDLLKQVQTSVQPEEVQQDVSNVLPADDMPELPEEADPVTVGKEEPNQGSKQSGVLQSQVDESIQEVNGQQLSRQDGQDSHSKRGSAERNGHETSPILQSLKEVFSAEPKMVGEAMQAASGADTSDIMRQIMDYMKIQTHSDLSSLEMQLHPASLGTLQVQLASKGGNVTAQFITQSETVKAVIESQMVQLKENFAQQGIKVEAIEVTVQPHAFERNLDQGDSRSQEDTGKRGRSRKFQAVGMEEADDLTQAEQMAAEIMAANGSTVEYAV